MDSQQHKPAPPRRRENPIFTVWVHIGYTVLVITMISWMVYLEFFL